MIKYKFVLLLYLSLPMLAIAQESQDSIAILKNELESFQYSQVINGANALLKNKAKINEKDLVEIFRIKAIAQFSLLNEKGAKESFFEILKIDTTYNLDASRTSPKIIAFFDQVKNDYQQVLASEKQLAKTKTDTVYIPKIIHEENSTSELKQAVVRSVILPGWGHLYLSDNLKGTILTSLSLITLGSSIYFLIDSNKKEKLYLDAVDPSIIQQKYNSYNTSYKMKNISMISFAVVWLYSQVDLLFFSGRNPLSISNVEFLNSNHAQLNFQFRF